MHILRHIKDKCGILKIAWAGPQTGRRKRTLIILPVSHVRTVIRNIRHVGRHLSLAALLCKWRQRGIGLSDIHAYIPEIECIWSRRRRVLHGGMQNPYGDLGEESVYRYHPHRIVRSDSREHAAHRYSVRLDSCIRA